MSKRFLTAAIIIASCVASQAAYQWSSVQIWGGGYVPGVAFHPEEEGLAYIRTDVGGAYRLGANGQAWTPLNDMFTSGNDMGSIAIGLDAGDPNAVYVTGGLYLDLAWCGSASFFRSENKGQTWTKVELNSSTVTGLNDASTRSADGGGRFMCLGGNSGNRGTGNRIAAFGDLIFLGTDQNGLLMSSNKGNTWATVSEFSNTSGISAVQFDKNGNVFVAPFAGGLYRGSLPITTGEMTWSRIGDFDGVIYQMSYSPEMSHSPEDHAIWFTTNTGKPLDQSEPSGGSVYMFDIAENKLTKITTLPDKGGKDYGYIGISVNPKDVIQILVSTGGWWKGTGSSPLDGSAFEPHEEIFMSMDGGATWKPLLKGASYDTDGAYNAATHNPHWISALAVNPHDLDHVIFGTGYGVWSTFNATAATPEWHFTNRGIEETVPLGLISTRYGAPLVSVLGDIDGFYHDDLTTPPLRRHKLGDGVTEAGTNFDIDYAGLKHNYVVRVHKNPTYKFGNYSEDGGKTWKNFGSNPPVTLNQWGSSDENNFIAVSADASTMMWNMAGHGVYKSTDNGATWQGPMSFPAWINYIDNGHGTFTTTIPAKISGFRVVSDKVAPNTFYLYSAVDGVLYKNVDGEDVWSAVNTTQLAKSSDGDWAYGFFRIFVSPTAAGEIWAVQGAELPPVMWLSGERIGGIRRSTDGGETFTEVSGMPFATSIGFGKGATSEAAPIVYAVGRQIAEQPISVFSSDNSGGSWTRINSDASTFGEITMVIGDPCVSSRVFLGTSGRGIIMGGDPAAIAANVWGEGCQQRIDNPNYVSVSHRTTKTIRKPTLVRHGNILRSSAPIKLYTLKGRMIASSSTTGRDAMITLNLSRVPSGVYIAKSGAETLRVRLQK